MQGREDGGQAIFAHKMKTVIASSNSLKWKPKNSVIIYTSIPNPLDFLWWDTKSEFLKNILATYQCSKTECGLGLPSSKMIKKITIKWPLKWFTVLALLSLFIREVAMSDTWTNFFLSSQTFSMNQLIKTSLTDVVLEFNSLTQWSSHNG